MDKLIPVLSLLVAALAVFVGPILSQRIARRQIMSSLEVANKQIIGPMRQAWINSLRDLLAELAGTAHFYFEGQWADLGGGYVERISDERLRTDEQYERLSLLEHKIRLMLNPKEDDHSKLEQHIRAMIDALNNPPMRGLDSEEPVEFVVAHSRVMELSREVLKREWDRVKAPIEL